MTRARYVTCGQCDGSGYLDRDGQPAEGVSDMWSMCRTCDGRGEVREASTAPCNTPRIETGD